MILGGTMTVVEYNDKIRKEYERIKSIELLERYVISETLSPIADFGNAIHIIRSHYVHHTNVSLLIVGAYLISKWTEEDNEMLNALNCIYTQLPNKQKAVTCFLNAYHMYMRTNDFFSSTKCKEWLLESIKLYEQMVNSRLLLAGFFEGLEAKKIYTEAISHVEKVRSAQEIKKLDVACLSTVEEFVNEHIIGIHLTEENMKSIQSKI